MTNDTNPRSRTDGTGSEGSSSTEIFERFSRRDYLKFTGAAAVAGLGATGTAAAADYDEVPIGAGDDKLVQVGGDNPNVLENKLYDVTADNATLRIRTYGDNWTIRNIGVKGQNTVELPYTINVDVREGGTGVIENVYLGDGAPSEPGGIAIKVHLDHAGTAVIRNCYIEGWPENGIYGASPGRDPPDAEGGDGAVQIEQCYARNNNLSNFRIADNSYVHDSVVHVDGDVGYAYGNPGDVNSRGVWVKEGGKCEVRNCDIKLEHPDASYCVVVSDAEEEDGHAEVIDSQLFVSDDVDSDSFSSGGNGGGLTSGNVDTTNVGNNPDVSVPSSVPQSPEAAASGSSGGGNDGGNDGGGDDGGNDGGGSSLPRGITLVGHQSDQINYSFGVSGDVEGNNGIESNDSVGSDGQVAAAVDSYDQDNYRFSGDFEYFNYSGGDLRVTVDGQSKDPDNLGGSSSGGGGGGSSLPNGVTIVGHQSDQINYSFGVSGDLEGNSDIESNDSVGSDGQVAAAVDSYDQDNYRFSGDFEYFNYSGGDLRVTVNGQSKNPDNLGGSSSGGGGGSSLPKGMTVVGHQSGQINYSFGVSGDLEGNNDIESNDSVGSDGQAAAAVDSYDQDNYRFSGEVEYFNYSGGDLRLTIDGQSRDPDSF